MESNISSEEKLNLTRQEISRQIRERRAELGISQAALAEMTGMGIATIKRFEVGRFWINMKQYILIREALKLPIIF